MVGPDGKTYYLHRFDNNGVSNYVEGWYIDGKWVEELNETIAGNVDYACDYIEKHFDGVSVSKPQGTYMLFVDCTQWCKNHSKTLDDVLKAAHDVGVALQDGRAFHGPCHLRMNLALPLSRVQEAFRRLDKFVFNTGVSKTN